MAASDKLPKLVEDRNKRLNIKSKRRRNLLKKAIEIKRMCDLQMFIVLWDPEFDKTFVYNSSPKDFTAKYLKSIVDFQRDNNFSNPKITFIKDGDYHDLKVDKDPSNIQVQKRKQR